jgi:hypothetical protein
LLQKRLGFRMLMDVIPLDSSLVKGSHGNQPANPAEWPLLISSRPELLPQAALNSTEVCGILRDHVMGSSQ